MLGVTPKSTKFLLLDLFNKNFVCNLYKKPHWNCLSERNIKMNNKKNNQEYNLSVSQFARLCNTTRDTLRHYYEIGILVPRIDEENGYHYYSSSQISSFYFISTFRKAGCSLKEISRLIHDTSKENIRATADAKILEMKNELKKIRQKINTISMGLWLLDDYEKNKNNSPYLETLENFNLFKTSVSHKNDANHTSDIAQDIALHLKRIHKIEDLSSFPMGVTIDARDLLKENYVYNNVISISQSTDDNIHTFSLPSNRAVCCYHDHTKDEITATYRQMVDFITQKRLTICSDLHIISLINLYDTEEKHTYFKYLFICVE